MEIQVVVDDWMPEHLIVFANPGGEWMAYNLRSGVSRLFSNKEVREMQNDALREIGLLAE